MISSSLVKELRHMTSAPLMECKKALEETNGNLEEAKNFLRKKGQLLASKKSSREANEGVVAIHFDEAIKKVGMVKLSCETDFVARNDQFQETTEKLAKLASEGTDSFEEKQLEGTQVKDYLTEIIAEIRENIVLSQVIHWHWSDTAVVNFYVHHNNFSNFSNNFGKIIFDLCAFQLFFFKRICSFTSQFGEFFCSFLELIVASYKIRFAG